MTTILINANDPDHCEAVKRRTKQRNALATFESESALVRSGMIYEAWVANIMGCVRLAAEMAGVAADPVEYQTFRQARAQTMGLPELVECSAHELAQNAEQAIEEARIILYG